MTATKDHWNSWLAMWHGDTAIATEIIADGFVVHVPPTLGTDTATLTSPAGMNQWIAELHAGKRDVVYVATVGPLFDGELIAARWEATSEVIETGARRRTVGTDILRVADGMLVEYWLMLDQPGDTGV